MALSLTDHGWSYREYIWRPVSTDPALTKQMDERMTHLLAPALKDQPSAQAQAPAPPEETREEKEAAPLPQVVRGTRDGSPGIPVYEISRLYGHQTQTRGYRLSRNPLLFRIAGAGFEPATFGL